MLKFLSSLEIIVDGVVIIFCLFIFHAIWNHKGFEALEIPALTIGLIIMAIEWAKDRRQKKKSSLGIIGKLVIIQFCLFVPQAIMMSPTWNHENFEKMEISVLIVGLIIMALEWAKDRHQKKKTPTQQHQE